MILVTRRLISCTNLDWTNISVFVIEVGVCVFLHVGITESHVLYLRASFNELFIYLFLSGCL